VDVAEFRTGVAAGFLAFLLVFFLGFGRQLPRALSTAISLAFFSVPLVLLARLRLIEYGLWWYVLGAVAFLGVMMGLVFAEFAIRRRLVPDEQAPSPVMKALRAIAVVAAVVFCSSIAWLHVRVLAPFVTEISPAQPIDRSQGPAAPACLLSSPPPRQGSIA
jgi:TRAP-type C4-dicarboxylate transport system permease small subunit